MNRMRVFISGVQKELAEERAALRDYLRDDPLLRRFFEPFVFEDVPAADRRADELYLDEVGASEVYVGLLGNEYGRENPEGVSPTEREFERATQLGKHRLIFVKGADDGDRHPKMQALVQRAGTQLIRRRFATAAELIAGVYASLVQYLETKELIRTGPFDASVCIKATLEDLDEERMRRFVRTARGARGFPLDEAVSPTELLTHLNLLDQGRPTNAAVLLFAKQPQRFLLTSEVKCAHFHGVDVAKPIPSYQVYKGTVFELVDQAVDFILSKINLWVGTRKDSPQVPVEYEIPKEVVTEAIVNAVAHRDYTSNGSVQVMLFADRFEVWNPGALPPSLTLAKLRVPHGSVPGNPLVAEPLYLAKYIERMGTGTGDMIQRCRQAGLTEPEFTQTDGFVVSIRRRPVEHERLQPESRPESRPESQPEWQPESLEDRVLWLLASQTLGKAAIATHLGQKSVSGQLNKVIRQLLAQGLVEQTVQGRPGSRLQKYRLTADGQAALAARRKP